MRKGLTHFNVALFCLAIILNGCGNQISTAYNKQPSDLKNQLVQQVQSTSVYNRSEIISSPDEALQLLITGNRRFVSGNSLSKDLSSKRRCDLVQNGQHPFAVIVGCSDSRVPPELLFDQALGDLFVIRIAGNVVSQFELGSVEYAVEHLKAPLVVVLGHRECGTVTAAVRGGETPGSISDVTEKIRPAVDDAKELGLVGRDLIDKSIDLNIQNTLADITKSPIIKYGLEAKRLKILGAKYNLDEGTVKIIND